MDRIEMTIPSKPQYLQVLRLSVASLANTMNFDIEAVEDLKVIISEIVNYIIPINDEIKVSYELHEDKLRIVVKAERLAHDPEGFEQEMKFRNQILETLTDEVKNTEDTVEIIKRK